MHEKHLTRRLLALIVALALSASFVVPVSAASWNDFGRSGSSGSSSGKGGFHWGGFDWSGFPWGGWGSSGEDDESETTPSTDPGVSSEGDSTLNLVENDTTVEEGTELRAATYTRSKDTIKYFPVTMYDYDPTTINNATHQVEVESSETLTQWNGIYFVDGNPRAEAYSQDGAVSIEDGTYILQNARAAKNIDNSWLKGNTSGMTGTQKSGATRWTIQRNTDGTYTLNSKNGYMTIGGGENGEKTANAASNIEIVPYSGGDYSGCVQLKSGGYYLCQWGGKDATVYGGFNKNNDAGNAFYLYKVTDSGTTEKVTFATPASLPYAAWNFWTGHLGGNKDSNFTPPIDGSNGNYLYSGLVESTLDANKNIVFTKPEGGIFNSDASVKTIYTNVELPFLYENGTYTFDASQNAVYFHEDSTKGFTTAQSNGRLYLSQGTTQTITDLRAEDGSTTVFMPFNDATTMNTSTADYWFGMAATIPFTMTTNGRLKPNDDSDPIKFSFSGDDDVWVFIDGQLVIDLGGIHNRLDATIDFAANTVTYAENNTANGAMGDAAGVMNVSTAQTLFGGLISQDRTTFAATDSHELTIYYLERGAGSSNCKIQFNLPMKDVVSVTKRATQSISSDGTLSPLTAKEQATVDNIDFGFTLTKNGTAVANTNYSLLNANGQVIDTPSTDANGKFTLRNGQTAKFVGEIAADGAEYQVVEDAVEGIGFKLPTYTYSGTAAGGYTVSSTYYSEGSAIPATKENLTSAAVTAKGSTEAKDSLQFICENYFDANLPNPSSRPVDDQIVIDYGLPVIIDALANDVYRGDTIELTDVTGAQYGTATIENGKITYQLTKQLTGVEVLTYTAKVTGSGNEGTETTTESQSRTAKIYIIPATSMYYEENFSNMVTYVNGRSRGWEDVGTAQTDPQEPGVVGTVGDSPYGSDAAYLNDSGDSNGSSKRVDTTDGAAGFCYTFTGTGTAFFARTSANSGYFKVEVFAGESASGTAMLTRFVDTKYVATDSTAIDGGTLYNIPVFNDDFVNYGTYTVRVTIFKKSETCGSEFYLDGIRVINPLFEPANPGNLTATQQVAQTAYSADGESNMTVVTLRQKLIAEAQINADKTISWNEGDKFVLFTDSNGAITSAEEYKSNGPKEEVYLNNGQSVTFSLYDWDPNTNKIYLGVKAPVGSGTVSINGNALNINNAADCYYDISSCATITTDADNINTATFEVKATSSLISVTNIKVTGNAQFTIVQGEDIEVFSDIEDELTVMNPEESDQPTTPEDNASEDDGSGDGSVVGSTETTEETKEESTQESTAETTEQSTEGTTESSTEEGTNGEEDEE